MKIISPILNIIDNLFVYAHLNLTERNVLLTFLFHGLFANRDEIKLNLIDPQQGITVVLFDRFCAYYLKNGFKFVSPIEILTGLYRGGKYALITFDDGYFNNMQALPILLKYRIPAMFFITTNNVLNNETFWWDVLYRDQCKRKLGILERNRELNFMKTMTHEQISAHIVASLGLKSFLPLSDLDRPMTTKEVKKLSRHPYVFIGNHTTDHSILTNYSPEGITSQILGAQHALKEITGEYPSTIAYPNGNYNPDIIRISCESGLSLGITTEHRRNMLENDRKVKHPMRLGRFLPFGSDDFVGQLYRFRSNVSLKRWIKDKINWERRS
jgi:peptidoglycan/xylan/chitin deacetylase (PgdA/CDA1 family)